jgi:hypothetical protein
MSTWFSPLLYIDHGGGAMLMLPYESCANWRGSGDDYEDMIDSCDGFMSVVIKPEVGLLITSDEGINEAHWMRVAGDAGLTAVVWIEWNDPARPSMPEDVKAVAQRWEKRLDPRQAWLESKLSDGTVAWERHGGALKTDSGVLMLMHAEGRAAKAKLAKPRAVAGCGQFLPAAVAPGSYFIETATVNELPDGANLCLLARLVPCGA